MPQVCALVCAGIIGAIVGDQLHGSVSDQAVVRIILALLLMGMHCISSQKNVHAFIHRQTFMHFRV